MTSLIHKHFIAGAREARMRDMRSILSLLIVATLAVIAPAAPSEKSSSNGVESLGGRLLDDLSPETAQPKVASPAPQERQSVKEIEDSLKASTPMRGFGARANPAAQSLARVQSSMQRAQSMLAQADANLKGGTSQAASPVQQEILSDLDKLIADLSKKCQCCNGQCQGGQCNQPKECQNPKPGKSGAAAGSGRTAARDSTDRLDRSSAKPVDKGEVNEMVKALWGHLPERSREQMLQSFSDEFLPKYELEIEQYYRRLSEEQGAAESK